MPSLSVLMPMRDAASTVGLAVRSTLAAMPRDSELLVYDDASRDSGPAAVAAIEDPRVRLVTGLEPRGVAGGLNLLLDQADSPRIARMDADDVSLPWRFRAQARALRQHDADVVFGGVTHFGNGGRRLRPHPPVGIAIDAMPFHLVLGNPVSHSTMYADATHVRAAGGYRAVATEDYDLWLRLAARGTQMMRSAAPVVLYRVHAAQVTASASWKERPPLEPALVESYAALCRRALGREPVWFPNSRRNRQSRQVLTTMAEAIHERSRTLSRAQRVLLQRKVRTSLSYAEESP